MLWLKRQADTNAEGVLLYGAGVRASLYLKDRAIKTSRTPDGCQILGFIDDEKSLHYQWVYGFLVLGGSNELPQLIERWKVRRVIIVSELLPENRAAVQAIAARTGIRLSEWQPGEREIAGEHAELAPNNV